MGSGSPYRGSGTGGARGIGRGIAEAVGQARGHGGLQVDPLPAAGRPKIEALAPSRTIASSGGSSGREARACTTSPSRCRR